MWEILLHRPMSYGAFESPKVPESAKQEKMPSKAQRGLDAALTVVFFGTQLTYRRRLENANFKSSVRMMPAFHHLFSTLMREWTGEFL